MKRKDKLSLAKSKPDTSQSVVAFTNPDLEALHLKFTELQETTVKTLEFIENNGGNKAIAEHAERITELNNTLVKTITVMEQSANKKELPDLLKKLIDKEIPQFPTEIKTSNPVKIPAGLATDASVKAITTTLKEFLQDIKKMQPQPSGQTPGDFVPMRRVRMDGKKLVFDDSYYGAASGGAGASGGGGLSTNDGSFATPANQTIELTRLGDVTETAPATDTASSGLNGRLQRIAQRLTSLIALLPGSLGQKARASSFGVTLSSEDITALTPPAAITGFATSSNQTNGTQQTKLTDGTNTANVVAGDTGFNGVTTSSGVKTLTFTTSTPGSQTLLANTDVRGYSWVEVVYTSVGTGLTVGGQFSTVSGGTYVSTQTWQSSTANNLAPAALGAAVNTIYSGPIRGNYFQLIVAALASGTFTGTVTLRTIPPAITSSFVSAVQSGAWTVGSNSATGSAVPANAFYMGLSDGGTLRGWSALSNVNDANTGVSSAVVGPMLYNGSTYDKLRSATAASQTTGTGLLGVGNLAIARTASPTAYSQNNFGLQTMDVMGEILVATGGLVTTSVPANASNVVVKNAPGRLCNILVTTTGVTAMVVYDNATTNSGTIIGQLPASAAVGSIYQFNMPAAAGITIAGSATNPAVTVSWI